MAKTVSDDVKAIHMSIGIAFLFFGSNTTQNFVVPIYGSYGAFALGIMYVCATLSSFFAPCIISRFSSERKALACFSLFIGSFSLNYPALFLSCSAIHGLCLSVFWSSQGMYLGCISNTSNRGKRAGTFWAIFMAGNISYDMSESGLFLMYTYLGIFPQMKPGWNGAISILFIALAISAFIGGCVLSCLPPGHNPEQLPLLDTEAPQPSQGVESSSSRLPLSEVAPEKSTACSGSIGILQGMKYCCKLMMYPKFLLLVLTMFCNGYIAIFVPSQMNRQVHDTVIVGVYMSIYACSEIFYSKIGAVISDKYGAYYVILIGTVSQLLGQVLMVFNDTKQNVVVFIVAYVFFGGADSCFQTQALALTLYYFPGLSSTANSCFRLIQFISGATCSFITPLFVKNGVVTWDMLLLENGVMVVLLMLAILFLTIFVRKYKQEIEYDDKILHYSVC